MTEPASDSREDIEKFIPVYKPPWPTEEELHKAEESTKEEQK